MFPIIPADSATGASGNTEGIFGFGNTGPSYNSITNLVSNTGVVSSNQAATTGTARGYLAACEYGEDKGIFGYGRISPPPYAVSMTNLVSNTGVVASDVSGVGSARKEVAACGYGEDKGIFGFGSLGDVPTHTRTAVTNLVSNAGVVASDTAGVGTARGSASATQYGGDKGIFGFGNPTGGGGVAITNLVSNAGVVASDQAAVTGTVRQNLAACSYGADKGIFGYGSGPTAVTNLVSNAGVVSSDVAGVGTARQTVAACSFN